jgi:hypothetical protein
MYFCKNKIIGIMSQLVIEVNQEQEKVIATLLQYMNVPYQRISPSDDFWDGLSLQAKERIIQGLADVDLGRYTTAKTYLKGRLEA